MSNEIKSVRRVVTGHDAQGRSCVLFDSAAPSVKASPFQAGTSMTDVWVFDACPALITGTRDDGNRPFCFEPPRSGGHLRIVQSTARPPEYDPARDRFVTPAHPPRRTAGGTFERGGQNLYTTRMHKSETLDYGMLLSGERVLITDDGERVLRPGDVVVQIGSWHAWSNPEKDSRMAFVMMGASLAD
jgi:hypothetical protein